MKLPRLRVTGWGPFAWPGEQKILREAAEAAAEDLAALGLAPPSGVADAGPARGGESQPDPVDEGDAPTGDYLFQINDLVPRLGKPTEDYVLLKVMLKDRTGATLSEHSSVLGSIQDSWAAAAMSAAAKHLGHSLSAADLDAARLAYIRALSPTTRTGDPGWDVPSQDQPSTRAEG